MRASHLVAAITAALMSASLSAQSVKDGITAWQKSDYAGAVAIWRPLAQRGDADAQFNLGQAYRLGRGVPIDLPMAKIWFEKAAQAGHVDAETTLGLLVFQNGDHAAGLKWLRKAAEQGEPRALLVYGTALYNGDGVTQDRVLGYAYVTRAASEGLAPAKDTLSQLDSLMSDVDRRKALQLVQNRTKTTGPLKLKAQKPFGVAAAAAAPIKKQMTPASEKPAVRERQSPATRLVAEKKSNSAPLTGNWRIQLGAFSKRSSAESLYRRLSSKPALAGKRVLYVPVGSMTRLQIGPFETRAAAAQACTTVGTSCFVVRSA